MRRLLSLNETKSAGNRGNDKNGEKHQASHDRYPTGNLFRKTRLQSSHVDKENGNDYGNIVTGKRCGQRIAV